MADPTTATVPTEHPKPTTFWQYVVVYPALAMGLAGSIPTVVQQVKAWRLETTAAKVQLVAEQQQLWERNVDCLHESGMYEVDGPHGIVIRVTLCSKTGDTLIRYHVREWPAIYRWVSLPVEKVKQ